MSEKIEVTASLAQLSANGTVNASDYNIPITIKNQTGMGFLSAEVACKDEDSQTARTAKFGKIPPGTTSSVKLLMPGGIESVLYKINPDVGDPIIGFGLGVNAPEVMITITP